MKSVCRFILFFLILLCSCAYNDRFIRPSALKNIFDDKLKSDFKKNVFDADGLLKEFYEYYLKYDIKNCDKDLNEDMLLFEYGFYDSDGKGDKLEIDIVRQYMKEIFFFGETYIKLHITLYYKAEDFQNKFDSFSLYYDESLTGKEWMDEIEDSEGWAAVKNIKPYKYELYFDFAE